MDMQQTKTLFDLYNRTSRDERGIFKEGPETDAFFDLLLSSTPMNPLELLELAASMRTQPARASVADFLAFQALSAIAHDPTILGALAKIGAEATPWGVTVDDLFRKIVGAHRGAHHPGQRYTLGTGGNGGPMAFSNAGCRPGCTRNAKTWLPGKCTITQLNPQAMAYLGLPWRYYSTCCINGNLCVTYFA